MASCCRFSQRRGSLEHEVKQDADYEIEELGNTWRCPAGQLLQVLDPLWKLMETPGTSRMRAVLRERKTARTSAGSATNWPMSC